MTSYNPGSAHSTWSYSQAHSKIPSQAYWTCSHAIMSRPFTMRGWPTQARLMCVGDRLSTNKNDHMHQLPRVLPFHLARLPNCKSSGPRVHFTPAAKRYTTTGLSYGW